MSPQEIPESILLEFRKRYPVDSLSSCHFSGDQYGLYHSNDLEYVSELSYPYWFRETVRYMKFEELPMKIQGTMNSEYQNRISKLRNIKLAAIPDSTSHYELHYKVGTLEEDEGIYTFTDAILFDLEGNEVK